MASPTLLALLVLLLAASPAAAQTPDTPASPPERAAEAEAPVGTEAADDDFRAEEFEAGESDPAGEFGDDFEDEELYEVDYEAEGSADDVEEITVTGTRSNTLSDASLSATEFGAGDLKDLRIQDIADLSAYTPNLEINTAFAASNPTLFIRGVGLKDYNANAAGAVAIYQDGIYLNSPAAQLFQLFDIGSVQVLRGPQGSTNGRNATAGAILVESVKPDGDWSSNGSFTYGNLNTIEIDGAIGFPILPNAFKETLSGRIAAVASFRDGYVRNRCAGWNPEAEGYAESSEANSKAIYSQLNPSLQKVTTYRGRNLNGTPKLGEAYVYNGTGSGSVAENRTAVLDLFNELGEKNGQQFNTVQIWDPVAQQPAETAVQQGDVFFVKNDGICLLNIPGRIVTPAGNAGRFSDREIGEYIPTQNARLLEDFQGLKPWQNNVKQWAMRGLLRFQPTEELDFLLNFHWGQNRGDSYHLQMVGAKAKGEADEDDIFDQIITEPLGFIQSENVATWSEVETGLEPIKTREGLEQPQTSNITGPGFAGADPYQGYYDRDGLEYLDIFGVGLTSTWELELGTLTSITGYEQNDRFVEDEGDDCPCTLLEADYVNDSWQISQDLRLEGEGDGFTWLVGSYFLFEDLTSGNLFTEQLGFGIDQTFEQQTYVWYLYGRSHYDFFEEGMRDWLYQLSIDIGFRYNWENKDFALQTVATRNGVAGDVSILDDAKSGSWTGMTGDVTLSYEPVEDSRLYLKYSRGMKAGHFNAGLTLSLERFTGENQSIEPVAPEFVHAIEFGTKSTLLDSRVELNAALFRYWYTDMQVFDIVNESNAPPTQQLLSSNADVLGIEIETQVRPDGIFDGLLITGAFGWLDSKFTDFLISKRVRPGSRGKQGKVGTFDYSGNPTIAAPEFSLSGVVEYDWMIGSVGSLVPRFDFSWRSRSYLDPQMEALISQPAYALLNARLAYRTPDGRWEVAAWVRNLADERYKVDVFDLSRQYKMVVEIWSEPRTFGITTSLAF